MHCPYKKLMCICAGQTPFFFYLSVLEYYYLGSSSALLKSPVGVQYVNYQEHSVLDQILQLTVVLVALLHTHRQHSTASGQTLHLQI